MSLPYALPEASPHIENEPLTASEAAGFAIGTTLVVEGSLISAVAAFQNQNDHTPDMHIPAGPDMLMNMMTGVVPRVAETYGGIAMLVVGVGALAVAYEKFNSRRTPSSVDALPSMRG